MGSSRSSTGTRAGLALLAAGTVAVGVAFAGTIIGGATPAWAPWSLAGGSAAASTALFVLGAATRGTLSRGIIALLAALFVVIATAFGAALGMPVNGDAGGRLLFGLPVRLAIVFYGVGFVPLVALPIAFAATFDAADNLDHATRA